jgi:hypothetical protein
MVINERLQTFINLTILLLEANKYHLFGYQRKVDSQC